MTSNVVLQSSNYRLSRYGRQYKLESLVSHRDIWFTGENAERLEADVEDLLDEHQDWHFDHILSDIWARYGWAAKRSDADV